MLFRPLIVGVCLLPVWTPDEAKISVIPAVHARQNGFDISLRGTVSGIPRASIVTLRLRPAMTASAAEDLPPMWETSVRLEKNGFAKDIHLGKDATLPGRYELEVTVEAGNHEEGDAGQAPRRRVILWLGEIKEGMNTLTDRHKILSEHITEIEPWIEEAAVLEKEKQARRTEFNHRTRKKYQDLEGRSVRCYFLKPYHDLAQLLSTMTVPDEIPEAVAAKEAQEMYPGVDPGITRKTAPAQKSDLAQIKKTIERESTLLIAYALDRRIGEIRTVLAAGTPIADADQERARDDLKHIDSAWQIIREAHKIRESDDFRELRKLATEIVETARGGAVHERFKPFDDLFKKIIARLKETPGK